MQTMFAEKNDDCSMRGIYNYEHVKFWSKNVPGKDIFNMKYIICPVNIDNLHWTVAVIFMEDKRIQWYDSFGGTDQNKLNGLLQYLKDEHRSKKGTELEGDWSVVPCTRITPRQLNGKSVLISISGDFIVIYDVTLFFIFFFVRRRMRLWGVCLYVL